MKSDLKYSYSSRIIPGRVSCFVFMLLQMKTFREKRFLLIPSPGLFFFIMLKGADDISSLSAAAAVRLLSMFDNSAKFSLPRCLVCFR